MDSQITEFVKSRPMVGVTLMFIVGIISESIIELGWIVLLLATVILALLYLVLPDNKSNWLIIGLVILAGAIRMTISTMQSPQSLSQLSFVPDSVYQTYATVQLVGQTKRGTPKYILEPISIENQRIADGKIILYAKDLSHEPEIADTIQVRLMINQPRTRRNPHDFDYQSYLYSQDIFFEAFLEDSSQIIIFPNPSLNSMRMMANLRESIMHQFQRYLSNSSSGIMSALILGERSEVDEETRADFANTGVIHVLAVSGLHVGYVLLILITIFGMLRFPYSIQMVFVIVGLVFYVLLTGGAASVMRASIMASLFLVGGIIERKPDVFNILASAAFIILLIDPDQIYGIGFQLSFSAVVSIVSLYPRFKSMVPDVNCFNIPIVGKILRSIMDLFLVSLAAQLGTLAITAYYFHKIPIISLIANLFVVPLIGIVVATGMSFLLIGSLFATLAGLWAATIDGAISLMLWIVEKCAGVDWAYLPIRVMQYHEVVIVLLAVFSIAFLSRVRLMKLWLILLLIWGNANIWQSALGKRLLEVMVLDVGQGDAIVMHTPNGKTMIIDAGLRFGGKDMGKDVIGPYLNARNWQEVDLLVITHPHNDHIGGAEYLIKHFPVKKVYMHDMGYDSYGYKSLQMVLDSLNIPVMPVYSGMVDSSLYPLLLRGLAPKAFHHNDEPGNINNASIVLQAFYGDRTVLLTGDGEEETEEDQLAYGNLLKTDIIKAPHHGSKTSSTPEYIERVRPKTCIISLGKKNKFKHPSAITLQRYQKAEADIHRTDEEGAIHFLSDGKTWLYKDWRVDN